MKDRLSGSGKFRVNRVTKFDEKTISNQEAKAIAEYILKSFK
jgi:hypothetical protein